MTSTTRQTILSLIKRRGPMTVQELSRSLEITPMGVRQHLAILERDGFVCSNGVRRGQGRPSRVYALTPKGDAIFPRTYEQVAVSLLEDIRTLDGEAKLAALLEHRRKRQLEQYRAAMAGKEFAEKVAILARLRDEEGYLAEHRQEDKDTFALVEHHCPIRSVAEACHLVCSCEMALFAEALEAEVVRTHHIVAGAPECRYVLTRPREGGRRK